MIIVAIAEDDGEIAEHLGHCKAIHFYRTENGKILDEEKVICTGQGHEYMLALLVERKAQVLVCNSIGKPAVEGLEKRNVEIFPALVGDVREAILEYLDGSLPKVPVEHLFHSCCHHGQGEEEGCHCHCCHDEGHCQED